MDQDKVRQFWTTVADHGPALCAMLDASAAAVDLQPSITRIGRIVETLRDAAADIDPVLRVGLDQVPANDGAVLRIAISCNHDTDGIEAVQRLVAAAPMMPPRIRVCAFSQPLPWEMACGLGPLEFLGHDVLIHQVRFLAKPSPTGPGTFDIACFVPELAVTDGDTEDIPGALFANLVLSMGIGELRVMTRVNRIDTMVTDQAPAEAVHAWDLVDLIDSALTH